MKDNFSQQANLYAQFRPQYPPELFQFIASVCEANNHAWDCGTGNGQAAELLADHFQHVEATDISRQQLEHAIAKNNIHYSLQPAEQTSFSDNYFDCITIAQAIHWFKFDMFYKEVMRVAKHQAIVAVIGYDRIKVDSIIDPILDNFYFKTLGPYWDAERKYIDELYRTIPFPFQEIQTPSFEIKYHWNAQHFLGYLSTWSAVKHFENKTEINPIKAFEEKLQNLWIQEKEIKFQILLRVGSISKY